MGRRISSIVLTWAATLSVLLMCFAQGLRAQESAASASALAVSPAILEQVLEPGKPAAFTLQVSNITNFPLPVKAMVRNFVVQSPDLEKTERERLDASQWFTIQEPDFILQPKQTRTVKGILQPPADAEPGGHYATIYFQPLIPQQALSPATAYMNSQVGVLAFLIVKGDITRTVEYANNLHAPNLVQGGPVNFTFSLRNTGSVHAMPTGKLSLYDSQGRLAHQLALPINVILPDGTKEYTLAWENAPAIGMYRAELEVTYSSDAPPLPKQSVTVWIVPWISITAGLIIGVAILVFIIKTRHRWRKAWRALREKEMRLGS